MRVNSYLLLIIGHLVREFEGGLVGVDDVPKLSRVLQMAGEIGAGNVRHPAARLLRASFCRD